MFLTKSATTASITGVQVFRCSGVQVFRCSGVQVFRCSGVQGTGCPSLATEPAGNCPHRLAGGGEEVEPGSERGTLRGGGPASGALEEVAGGVDQGERGRMHGAGAREGGRVPQSYGRSLSGGELNVKIPESTKLSLQGKLLTQQRERWPQLQDVRVRFRGNLAYVDGVLPDGDEDSFLPSGAFEGTPAEALDCACGLYLSEPSA